MSPNTLKMLETLCRDFSTVEHEYIDMLKRGHRNCVIYNDPKQDRDYDDDTDSDYVPNSGEETNVSHSSVKQNKWKSFQVLESDSSDDETIQRGLISSHIAMVHDNQTRTDRTTQMLHN
ncbi:unnamed protein product [Parnassius mnemosyne]